MKTKVLFIIFIALTVAIVGWVNVLQGSLEKATLSRKKTTPTPQVIAPSQTPSSDTASFVESKEGNIRVSQPQPNTTLHVPFTIQGEARVFENVVSLRIENQNKEVMYQGFVTAQSPDVGEFGPFEIKIDGKENTLRNTTNTSSGTIIVFENSAKDGSEINVVKIPFTLVK